MRKGDRGADAHWQEWERRVRDELASVLPSAGRSRGCPGTRVEAWPLIVELPLYWLGRALGHDRPGEVYLRLRDACEAVVRLMWAASVLDAVELAKRPEFLADAKAQRAAEPEHQPRTADELGKAKVNARTLLDLVREVLHSVVHSAFSPGDALRMLTFSSKPGNSVLHRLSEAMQSIDGAWTPPLAAAWEGSQAARKAAQQFRRWRNLEVGHGVAGSPGDLVERLTTARGGVPAGVSIARDLFVGLGPWLATVQERMKSLGWPRLDQWLEGTEWADEGAAVHDRLFGAPIPIAWFGRPEGALERGPYWVLDGQRQKALALLDLLHNGRTNAPSEDIPRTMLDLVERASWRLDPLDVSYAEVQAAGGHAESTFKERQVRTPATTELVNAVLAKPGWHLVTGPAGVGKTFLLRQLVAEVRERTFVLRAFTVPGVPHSLCTMLEHMTAQEALQRAGLEPVVGDEGAIATMPTHHSAIDEAHAWWKELAGQARDRQRPLVVVLDGLEETTAGDAWALGLLPPPGDAANWGVRVVLGYRSERELPNATRAVLRAVLGAEGSAKARHVAQGTPGRDATASARGMPGERRRRKGPDAKRKPSGTAKKGSNTREARSVHPFDLGKKVRANRAAFRKYLEEKHPGLAGRLDERLATQAGRTLFEELLERAQWRFLWVFHYARGLERGFLRLAGAVDADAQIEEWPRGDGYYREYLAWLERRVGGHPGYVSVLRRVLLTYAHVGMPINDRTLLWLLSDAHGQDAWGQGELWSLWVRPVLDDLADFLYRRRVGPNSEDVLERDAYAALAYDAAGRLEPPPLDGDVVCTAALLAPASSRAPARAVPRPMEAMVRSLAHDELATYLRSDALPDEWRQARDEVDTHLRERARTALSHFEAHPTCGRAWVRTCIQRIADLTVESGQGAGDQLAVEAVKRLAAIVQGLVRYELRTQPYPQHWVAVWRNLAEVLRGRAGFGDEATDGDIARALLVAPEVVQAYAVALHCLGIARRGVQRSVEAIGDHEEAVRILRACGGLNWRSPEEEIQRRWTERRSAVRSYAAALQSLGLVLLEGQRVREAVEVSREAVRILRVGTRLQANSSAEDIKRRWGEDRDAVALYCLALNTLGHALREAQCVGEAAGVHAQVVDIERVRARLAPESSDRDIEKRWKEDPDAMRDVAAALQGLGIALRQAQRAVEAVDCHRQEVRIKRLNPRLEILQGGTDEGAAGSGPESTDDDIACAWVEAADAMRGYTAALHNLGTALREAERPTEAKNTHEEELCLARVRAGLGPESTGDDIERRWAEDPDAVRGYLAALGGLADALLASQNAHEAVDAYEEIIRIERAWVRMGPGSPDGHIARRWEEDPDAVQSYSAALAGYGLALRAVGRVDDAVRAHDEEVRIDRVRARLSRNSTVDEIARRWKEDPSAVRSYSVALDHRGTALREAGRLAEAVETHQEELRIEGVRAGLGPSSTAQDIARRWDEAPDAVHGYSAALDGLGRALVDAGRAEEAVAAHAEELRIDRVRAALEPTSTEQDIAHRWNEAPDAVHNYLDALAGLGRALLAAGRADEAATIHEEKARVERVRARLERERSRHDGSRAKR